MNDPAGSWIQDVNLMKNWLAARVNWMDSQFPPEPVVTPGGNFGSSVNVTMTPVAPATLTDTQLIGPISTILYTVPTAEIANWQSPSFNPTGWSTGTTGLGYDTTTSGSTINYTPYIQTNVATLMNGTTKRSSIYTRMTFTISDPSSIQALILKIQYDDGFIAWVNGVRVMDANSPEDTFNPGFGTKASSPSTFGNSVTQLNDSQAILYREYDITSVKNFLVAGTNVLAIQGLNYTATTAGSEDFLLAPTLYARHYNYPATGTVYYTTDGSDPRTTTGAIAATAHVYTGSLALSSDTQIKARTLNGNVWGGLNSQVYTFDSTALRITELMYNPPPPPLGSPFTAQDFEFIELKNTATSPLNLAGYTLSNGVAFTFPSVILAPGAYAVVVKNLAAFHSRYGVS
jgi:hypothetical protein